MREYGKFITFDLRLGTSDYEHLRKRLHGKKFTGKELRDRFIGKKYKYLNAEDKMILASFNPYPNTDYWSKEGCACDFDYHELGISFMGCGFVKVENFLNGDEYAYRDYDEYKEYLEEKYIAKANAIDDETEQEELKTEHEEEIENLQWDIEYMPLPDSEIKDFANYDEYDEDDYDKRIFVIETNQVENWYV